MKLKQSVQLLLIALFVWVSQSTIIHFQHHDIDEISECSVCDTSKKLKLYQHNGHTVIIDENLALNIRKELEQVVVNSEFDYTEVPLISRMDIVRYSQYHDRCIILGFNATAPPAYFS